MRAIQLGMAMMMAAGCVETRLSDVRVVDMSMIDRAVIDLDRGDVTWRGLGGDEAEITLESWGRGARGSVATRNAQANTWSVDTSGSDLIVVGQSPFARSGIDVDVEGPDALDLEVRLRRGTVVARDVEGTHRLEAERVEGVRLVGAATVNAGEGGVELEIAPFAGADILIDTTGSVTLSLPPFGGYDLRVEGLVADATTVADLGWDELEIEETSLTAYRNPGTTQVRVYLRGAFRLTESAAPLP